jgi:hypothetical protein
MFQNDFLLKGSPNFHVTGDYLKGSPPQILESYKIHKSKGQDSRKLREFREKDKKIIIKK